MRHKRLFTSHLVSEFVRILKEAIMLIQNFSAELIFKRRSRLGMHSWLSELVCVHRVDGREAQGLSEHMVLRLNVMAVVIVNGPVSAPLLQNLEVVIINPQVFTWPSLPKLFIHPIIKV
jgi:hypothetical protein